MTNRASGSVQRVVRRQDEDARLKAQGWTGGVGKWTHPGWRGVYVKWVALIKCGEMERCSHKFVDSRHCLKCGWVPPNDTLCREAGQKDVR